MIPSFAETTTSPKSVPQPPRFRAPSGRIRDVRVDIPTRYLRAVGHTAAQQNGLRFESQVQEFLLSQFEFTYLASPTIWFIDDYGQRTCIPDGIYTHSDEYQEPRHIVVVEIKSQHMPEAYWQLKRLYEPVLRARDTLPVYSVEIVKSFDPSMPFPVEVELIQDLTSYLANPGPRFGVFRWRK